MTEYGARMERGICRSASEGGAVIESLDRPGIVTPPLKRADGSAPAAGENVWFWMSDDGSGMIGGMSNTSGISISFNENGDIVFSGTDPNISIRINGNGDIVFSKDE